MINLGAKVFINAKLRFIYADGSWGGPGEPLFELVIRNKNSDILKIIMMHKFQLNLQGQSDTQIRDFFLSFGMLCSEIKDTLPPDTIPLLLLDEKMMVPPDMLNSFIWRMSEGDYLN